MRTGQSVWMMPTRSSPGTSSAVRTAWTPGAAAAFVVSMRTTSALAWSASLRAACSMPGTRRSSMYGRSPRASSRLSYFGRRAPIPPWPLPLPFALGSEAGVVAASADSPAASTSTASRILAYPVQRQRWAPRWRAASSRARSAPFLSSSAFSRTTMPGVQKPHWSAPVAENASAKRRRSSGAMPSRVVTERPSTRSSPSEQAMIALPSRRTVQQPHWPDGEQPSFGEVTSSSSRSAERRWGCSPTSTSRPFRTNRATGSGGVVRDETRPGLAGECPPHVLRVGHDRLLAATVQIVQHGLDLRRHAAGGEVDALFEVLARLGGCEAGDEALVGLAEVEGDLLDGGRDEEEVGVELVGEERRGEVLVDDGGDAFEGALGVAHDRDPPAPGRDHDGAGLDEAPDGRHLDDPHRPWRGDHAPPSPVGVVDDVPALGPAPLGHRLIHERADRLARVLEGRVVGSHLGLADDGGGVAVHAEAGELVREVLLEGVADGALGVRPADVERHLVQLVGGELGPPQDETDLGTVAMGDDDVPAVLDHADDVAARLLGGDVLVADRLVLGVFDERVPADGDDGGPLGRPHQLIVRAMTAFWPCRRFSAWS